jgi:hypothetical protein
MSLRAPFPWFGGKSRAAHLVWPRFGNVANYIEPFAGSLAVLLARPEEFPPRVETVNDKDAYLSNFWRSLQHDPEQVAFYADWPVNEADLHARHRWLVETAASRVRKMMSRPDYFDAKVAGWWVWGQCLWIGSGWCSTSRRRRNEYPAGQKKRPHCDRGSGRGVHQDLGDGIFIIPRKRPAANGNGESGGVHRKNWNAHNQARRPHLMNPNGHGIHVIAGRRPNMGGRGGGQGVQAPRLHGQLPQLSGDGSGSARGLLSDGIARSGGLQAYMLTLAERLRRVRVCCGDWRRVITPAVTTYIGLTAVFLDPPYDQELRELIYAHDIDKISADVREWAIDRGDEPKMRIALCGYEGEHKMPVGWTQTSWTAGGGYGRTVRGKGNRRRERIWFSPHCLADNRHPLLAEASA